MTGRKQHVGGEPLGSAAAMRCSAARSNRSRPRRVTNPPSVSTRRSRPSGTLQHHQGRPVAYRHAGVRTGHPQLFCALVQIAIELPRQPECSHQVARRCAFDRRMGAVETDDARRCDDSSASAPAKLPATVAVGW